jgi:hypothetical protein
VHAQNEKIDLHWQAAAEGAWVEFDHVSPQTVAAHVELVRSLKTRGLLELGLVSHDAGWRSRKLQGGDFRPTTRCSRIHPGARDRRLLR